MYAENGDLEGQGKDRGAHSSFSSQPFLVQQQAKGRQRAHNLKVT